LRFKRLEFFAPHGSFVVIESWKSSVLDAVILRRQQALE
jgi:hypothetical protein